MRSTNLLGCCVVSAALAMACGGSGDGSNEGQATPPSSTQDTGTTSPPHGAIFFLHHSVGWGLIEGGDIRGVVADYNAAHGTAFGFWDHGYNDDGLRDPDGNETGTNYGIPGDNTDVEGLYQLWTSGDSEWSRVRNTLLTNYRVIGFKSCFPNSAISDQGMLTQYRQWYRAMRDVFDAHPDHTFIVMPPPPLHRLATNATEANNARAFATWLCSSDYLNGHPNVACFNLFDRLAAPASSNNGNRLRWEYEEDHNGDDSHPNWAANEAVGAALGRFFCQVAAR